MSRQPIPIDERFLAKVEKSPCCWIWTGGRWGRTNGTGHGKLYLRGGREAIGAHVYAWIRTYGQVPRGLHVLHSCDEPLCVRPTHLHLGTHADNVRERDERGRRVAPSGEAHSRSKVCNVARYLICLDPRKAADVAADYALSKDGVNRIRRTAPWELVRS